MRISPDRRTIHNFLPKLAAQISLVESITFRHISLAGGYSMVLRRLLAICIALFAVPSLIGQTPSASISGRVADQTGAAIPGASVTAVNMATNVKYSTETNGVGFYVVNSLPPGRYRVLVAKDGFAQIVKPDVELHVQDDAGINFSMRVGSATESVTVEGGAPLVDTQSAAVSTVVDQTYVKNMPLNGRSLQDLILLTPGVVPQTPQSVYVGQGFSGEFSVNGQRTEENYYTVDGVSANVGATAGYFQTFGAGPSGMVPGATALGTTQALVSVDDLQEFRVQSSSYSAEYGRGPGGQFAFQTKSGTNQWHGTAYDYLRNDVFDARDWFNDYFQASNPELTKPALRQNDFGGTLGGPLTVPGLYKGKDRTFFFVTYEGLRLTQPQQPSGNIFVPDTALRSDVASNQPALAPVLNAFPLQTPGGIDDTALGIAQYIGSWSNPSSINSTSARLDQAIGNKLRLFFRFSNTTSSAAIRDQGLGSSPSVETISSYTTRTYTGGATSLFSSNLSNDFRLNYTSNETAASNVIAPIGGGTAVDPRQLSGIGPAGSAYVYLSLSPNSTNLIQTQDASAVMQWNLVDTLSLTKGRHQFKFGGDYRRVSSNAILTTPTMYYNFFSISDVQNNNPFLVVVAGYGPAYPLYRNFSAFAQDEWRVSPRLSLSMGLRWELNPPPGVTQGLRPYTLQGTSLDNLQAVQAPLWKTAWFNFAPRLGAAYLLRNSDGWETVIRGGGGVFFDTGQQLGSQGFNGPGFSSGEVCFSASSGIPTQPGCSTDTAFPMSAPALVQPIQDPASSIPYNIYAYGFSPHLQLPYTLEWNASVQQALGKSQALTITYLGSRASRLIQNNSYYDANNMYTNYYGMQLVENSGYSRHEALQVQFNRRLSHGLTGLASYTWSHCIDTGSTNFNFGYRTGNCDFDLRHNFSAAFSYDLPNAGNNRFANTILHHWGLDSWFTARTAFPLNVSGPLLSYPNGKQYPGGVDLVPGQPIYLYGANCASVLQQLGYLNPGFGCPGGKALNPQAFEAAYQRDANGDLVLDSSGNPIPVQGNAPRNFARLFGAWQMNLGIRREFPINEKLKLQFRAEAFNIFNHPNFGTVDIHCSAASDPNKPGCRNPSFGQAYQTLANSSANLSSLYASGGARSIQFALKLVF